MNMKKTLAVFAVLLLLTVAAAGCSSPSGTEDSAVVDNGQAGETVTPDTIDSAYLMGVLAKGSGAGGMSYDMTMTAGGQTIKTSYYMEGSKFMMKGSYGGVESVTVADGESIITYDPAQKTGMKFANDSKAMDSTGLIDADLSDNYDPAVMTFLEKGDFDGEECLIVSSKDAATGTEVKMWINERLGMVVKMEGTSPDGQLFTTELTNIKLGKPAEGTFTVPSDVKIIELPGM